MSPIGLARVVTLVSYFGLLSLLTAWHTVIAPSNHFPVALVLIVLLIPLLLPLRGLLHGRAYTHAWASFLALFYFVHAVGETAAGVDSTWLGGSAIVLSIGFFTGSVAYARLKGRADKAALGEPGTNSD